MKKFFSIFLAAAVILLLPAVAGASQDYTFNDALAILRHEAGLITLSSSDFA